MKHADMIRQMTLEQKCTLLSGADTFCTRGLPGLDIPSLWLMPGHAACGENRSVFISLFAPLWVQTTPSTDGDVKLLHLP